MKFCHQCGSPFEENDKFCGSCGASQLADEQAQSEPQNQSEVKAQSEEPVNSEEQVLPDVAEQPPSPPPPNSPPPSPPSPDDLQPTVEPQEQQSGAHDTGAPPPPLSLDDDFGSPDGSEPKKPLDISKLLKIGIPAVVVVIVAIITIFSIVRAHPLAVTARALNNADAEILQRLEGSPLHAITLLQDMMQNGTLTVDIDYRDDWGGNFDGTVVFAANERNRDYLISIDARAGRQDFEAEAFINRNRIAVGSRMLDDNFYGITFNTFREDIRTFGRVIDLDRETMDALADIVEIIEQTINMGELSDTDLQPYVERIERFVMDLEPVRERTSITVGGSSTNVSQITYTITSDDIAVLLNDLVELLEADDNLREYFTSITESTFGRMAGLDQTLSYRDFVRDIRDAVREFNRYLSGELRVSLFVGRRDRLMRMETDADFRFDRERLRFSSAFDLGESAQDRWAFTFNVTTDDIRETLRIEWEYSESSTRVVNRIVMNLDDSRITMESEWNPSNGRFTLSYRDDWNSGEIEGVFRTTRDNFMLTIENPFPRNARQSLNLDIEVQRGAQIRSIEFINIDSWTENMLFDLEDAVRDLGW